MDVLRDYLKTAEFTSVLLLQQEQQGVPVPEHTFQQGLSLAVCFADLGRRPTSVILPVHNINYVLMDRIYKCCK